MKVFKYIDYQDKLYYGQFTICPEPIVEIEAEGIMQADKLFEELFTPTFNGKSSKIHSIPVQVQIMDSFTGPLIEEESQDFSYSAVNLNIRVDHPKVDWWDGSYNEKPYSFTDLFFIKVWKWINLKMESDHPANR